MQFPTSPTCLSLVLNFYSVHLCILFLIYSQHNLDQIGFIKSLKYFYLYLKYLYD